MKPLSLTVVDAFCAVLRGISSVRAVTHDKSLDRTKDHHAWVYVLSKNREDGDTAHWDVTMRLSVVVTFVYSERNGEGMRELGEYIDAEVTTAISENPTLGGLVWFIRPGQAQTIQTNETPRMGAWVSTWTVSYKEPLTNAYTTDVMARAS